MGWWGLPGVRCRGVLKQPLRWPSNLYSKWLSVGNLFESWLACMKKMGLGDAVKDDFLAMSQKIIVVKNSVMAGLELKNWTHATSTDEGGNESFLALSPLLAECRTKTRCRKLSRHLWWLDWTNLRWFLGLFVFLRKMVSKQNLFREYLSFRGANKWLLGVPGVYIEKTTQRTSWYRSNSLWGSFPAKFHSHHEILSRDNKTNKCHLNYCLVVSTQLKPCWWYDVGAIFAESKNYIW